MANTQESTYLYGDAKVAGVDTRINWEYTNKIVTDEFRVNLNAFKKIFSYGIDENTGKSVGIGAELVTLTDAQAVRSSIGILNDLAQNGRHIGPNGQVGNKNDPLWYLNPEMSEQLDLLYRSLGSVGIDVNNLPSDGELLVGLKKWRDLAQVSPVIQEIIHAIDEAATTGHRTLQSLIEMEYVKTGNQVMADQMESMEQALGSTKDVMNTLKDLQSLHNEITVVGKGKDPLGDYKNATQSSVEGNISTFFEKPINPIIPVDVEAILTELIKDAKTLAIDANTIINGTHDNNVEISRYDNSSSTWILRGVGGENLKTVLARDTRTARGQAVYGASNKASSPHGGEDDPLDIVYVKSDGQHNWVTDQNITNNHWENYTDHEWSQAFTIDDHHRDALYNRMSPHRNNWGNKLNDYLTNANAHNEKIKSLKSNLSGLDINNDPSNGIDFDALLLPTFDRISDSLIPTKDSDYLTVITQAWHEDSNIAEQYSNSNYSTLESAVDAFKNFRPRIENDFNIENYEDKIKSYSNKKLLEFGKKIADSYASLTDNINYLETNLLTSDALSNPTNLKSKLEDVKADLMNQHSGGWVENEGTFYQKTHPGFLSQLLTYDFDKLTYDEIADLVGEDVIEKIGLFAQEWVLDSYNTFTEGDVTNAGRIQQRLTTAITAGQSLNDAQKEEVRRFMFVFEEYYKSAAAMLSKITQLIEKIAQNINR